MIGVRSHPGSRSSSRRGKGSGRLYGQGTARRAADHGRRLDARPGPFRRAVAVPPRSAYHDCELDHGDRIARSDFERLVAVLASLRGRLVLSLDDQPEGRSIVDQFRIGAVETTYTLARKRDDRVVGELSIGST